MSNTKTFLLILVLSLGFVGLSPRSCFAQDQSISISGVTLKIGMSQSAVVEKLMEFAKVEKVQNASRYWIRERNGDTQRVIGNVLFENGRLVVAEKDWYNGYDAKGYETAELLTVILARMEQRGLSVASVSTKIAREPSRTMSRIELRFAGNIRISIYVTQESGGEKSLQITEWISAR